MSCTTSFTAALSSATKQLLLHYPRAQSAPRSPSAIWRPSDSLAERCSAPSASASRREPPPPRVAPRRPPLARAQLADLTLRRLVLLQLAWVGAQHQRLFAVEGRLAQLRMVAHLRAICASRRLRSPSVSASADTPLMCATDGRCVPVSASSWRSSASICMSCAALCVGSSTVAGVTVHSFLDAMLGLLTALSSLCAGSAMTDW